MTLEKFLDDQVFELIKSNFIRKIKATEKQTITENTNQLIEQLQKENEYERIDIAWDDFNITEKYTEYFQVDNYLMSKRYLPNDKVTGHCFRFTTKILKGDRKILTFLSDNIGKDRYKIYKLLVEDDTIAFDIVIFGNPNNPKAIAKKRNNTIEHLKRTIDKLNEKVGEYKKAIDDLIMLEVSANKKHYLDTDNFFGQIDEIK